MNGTKKKKASLTLPGRARTEITPRSIWSTGQVFFNASPSLAVGGLCHLVRGAALFSEELQDFFFFKCRRSPPSSGNSYMCQDGRVDSQSTREHTQSESWWDRPTRRSRGKLIVSQRFPSWSQHSQRRSSLEIASPLSKTQPDIQN